MPAAIALLRGLGKVVDTVVCLPIPGHVLPRDDGHEEGTGEERSVGQFLLGPENRLLGVALDPLLNGETGLYAPLVIVGPPGSGKSHVAAGLVALWRRRLGPRSALCVSALDFSHQWTEATETHATDDFQNRYRRVQLLAIDDVELLATKPSAQQELAHTIDALAAEGGLILLTCTARPELIRGFAPRLKSRMQAGLVVPLSLPTAQTRLAAVRQFAALRQLELVEDAAAVLAQGSSGPLCELWAAVLRLELASRVDGGAITARRAAQYLAERGSAKVPTLRDIAVATARQFSVRLGDLRSPSRRRAVVHARDVAMYLARVLTGKSFEQIGTYFHGRDHSTVSHGCSKMAELLKNDPVLSALVDRVRRELQAT